MQVISFGAQPVSVQKDQVVFQQKAFPVPAQDIFVPRFGMVVADEATTDFEQLKTKLRRVLDGVPYSKTDEIIHQLDVWANEGKTPVRLGHIYTTHLKGLLPGNPELANELLKLLGPEMDEAFRRTCQGTNNPRTMLSLLDRFLVSPEQIRKAINDMPENLRPEVIRTLKEMKRVPVPSRRETAEELLNQWKNGQVSS